MYLQTISGKQSTKSIVVQQILKTDKEKRYLKRHESSWNDPANETHLRTSEVM